MFEDTIAAISTAMGTGGIGIVRISGSKAFDIAQKICRSHKGKTIKQAKSHTIQYVDIIDKTTQKVIDEALVMIMKAPMTYTKEDVIEINCHGGIISVQKVLEAVLAEGCRLAEPGEFTKRAFLNGRIDLSQAEAVIDVINSKTDLFHKSAVKQLEGSLSLKVKGYRDELLTLIAHIEAAIDYPEHDIEATTFSQTEIKTKELIEKLERLISNANSGRIIKEGIETVIVGKPNVGKSSLLNVLTKQQRAIVTDIPGTTRDILEENINIGGVFLRIVDTAGIRETEDIIEKIGVEKSKEFADSADLILMVLDGSIPLDKQDIEIFSFLKGKKFIVIVNKSDLNSKLDMTQVYERADGGKVIMISAKSETGIVELENTIKEMFFSGNIDVNQDVFITNVRHKNILLRAIESLKEVINTINAGMPEDCMSIDLQKAYQILGEITGETVDEDIIDRIFSEFCLGK